MEHLETDVMRFMAILAFCLVAVFALVQSIPTTPPPEQVEPPPEEAEPSPRVADVTPAPAEIVPVAPTTPLPRIVPEPREPTPKPKTKSKPKPKAIPPVVVEDLVAVKTPPIPPVQTRRPAPEPAKKQAPTTSPQRRGFSLRFESDQALKQLVAEKQVGLYAIEGSKVWRMMMVSGRTSFRTAQSPPSFHEMAAATVPAEVVNALRRTVTVSPSNITWGVTLPASTSAQLTRIINNNTGGALVIDAVGSLRLTEE